MKKINKNIKIKKSLLSFISLSILCNSINHNVSANTLTDNIRENDSSDTNFNSIVNTDSDNSRKLSFNEFNADISNPRYDFHLVLPGTKIKEKLEVKYLPVVVDDDIMKKLRKRINIHDQRTWF